MFEWIFVKGSAVCAVVMVFILMFSSVFGKRLSRTCRILAWGDVAALLIIGVAIAEPIEILKQMTLICHCYIWVGSITFMMLLRRDRRREKQRRMATRGL